MQRVSKSRAGDGTPRRRQDPVSCRLCRVKKLKCNRQYPCSNCVARGATCEFESGQIGSTTVSRLGRDAGNNEDQPTNATILAKLQRLEDLLLQNGQTGLVSSPGTPDSVGMTHDSSAGFSNKHTSIDPHDVRNEPSPFTEAEELQRREIQNLTDIGRLDHSVFPGLSDGITFEVMPLQHIFSGNAISYNTDNSPFSRSPKRIFIPLLSEARFMYDKFAASVCYYHHIVHLPTLKASIENVYARLERNEAVEPSHVTLMIVVFATVLWYLSWNDADSTFMPSRKDRERSFTLWFKSALDVLDHTRRTLPASLEDLQAIIIVVFLDYNVEGFTARSRANLAYGVHIARDLALHRLDALNNPKHDSQLTKDELIQKEIKRRTWWHLASTEWMISLAGGPSEGTYLINPNHASVNLPKNINDYEFDSPSMNGDPPLTLPDHPLSIPTTMSYSLHRIKLSQISRLMIDAAQVGTRDLMSVNYEEIKSIDAGISKILAELPYFLRIDEQSVKQATPLLQEYPQFAMHRYLVNVSAHSIRCKLHQPFLVRGAHDKTYALSTEMCLNSAMAVLKINKMIKNEDSPYLPQQFRMVGLTHHLYLATVVLVMDLCFNGPNEKLQPRASGRSKTSRTSEVDEQPGSISSIEPKSLNDRYEEVLNAIGMLENSRYHSASTSKFLDTLMDVLRKYKVRLYDSSDSRKGRPSIASGDDAAATLVTMSHTAQNTSNQMDFSAPDRNEGANASIPISNAHFQDSIPTTAAGNTRKMWPSAGAVFQGPTSSFTPAPYGQDIYQQTQNSQPNTLGDISAPSLLQSQSQSQIPMDFQSQPAATPTASALDEVWHALSWQQQQNANTGLTASFAGGPLDGVAMPDWDQLFAELDGYIA